MASPVGHSLLALSIALAQKNTQKLSTRLMLLFVIVSANLADLDFLPGLLIGDMNRFHHGASHSLVFALSYALICYLIWHLVHRENAPIVGWLGFIAYSSHLLADYIADDLGAPYGIPLFWPFSPTYWILDPPILRSFSHGNVGSETTTVLLHIFSWHNVASIVIEVLIFLPLLLIGWIIHRKRQDNDPDRSP